MFSNKEKCNAEKNSKFIFIIFAFFFCSTLGLTATEIEKTANAFGSSMREIVFPGVSREVMFHSFDEDKRWTLGGLGNFFFILFFLLIFRRIWKVSRRLRRHLHPPAETPESWPERPIFISSKDVHYALITSPRGWTFKTDTWVSQNFINSARIKNSTVLSSKTQFEVFCYKTCHIFRGFF